MNQNYKQYGFDDIVDSTERESRIFRRYLYKGYITYLGKCRNVSRTYARKPKLNLSFQQYLEGIKFPVPNSYGMAKCDLDACFKSISKYDKGEPTLDGTLFKRACDWTRRRYQPYMGMSRVMETNEVLVHMDKTTSCGYPWNIKFQSKREFLNDSIATSVLNGYWHEMAKTHPEFQSIWKVAQKNELLPREKIDAGKVRTFTAAPIELSVTANRLFLDQNEKMNRSNIFMSPSSTSFVGGTKFAGGWHTLYQHLSRFMNAYELDESAYDSSLFRQIFEFLAEFRFDCIDTTGYTDLEIIALRNRVSNVYRSILNSLIVLENGDLALKGTGNPSGSTNTINDNTLALDVLFNYAWLVSCKKSGRETSYDDFNRHVCPVYNGDDNDYTCSDEVKPIICPQQVQEIWCDIGVMTRSPCMESRELKDISFLSQKFYWDSDTCKFYPIPERDKILCSLLYASSVNDIRWHYLRACALRIESFWDVDLRKIIYGYICFLEQNYQEGLSGTIKDLKWENIRALFMTDDDIKTLYSGRQSSRTFSAFNLLKEVLLDDAGVNLF